MPLPPVLVDIAAAEARPELVAALLSACSRAAGEAECIAAADDQADQPASAVAIVSWEGEGRVRIQVALRKRQEWRVRFLAFEEQDEIVERWKAAGYATGTLASRITIEQQLAVGEDPTDASVRPTSRGPGPEGTEPGADSSVPFAGPASPQSVDNYRFDLGLLVGPGLSAAGGQGSSPWRVGGVGRFSYAPLPKWPFGMVSLGYAVAGEDELGVSAEWLTLSLGAGYALLGSSCEVCVEVRAAALLQRVAVEARAPSSGFVDRASRWVSGVRLGADAGWMATPQFGPFVGLDLDWPAAGTDVSLRDQIHSSTSDPQLAVMLGLRVRPQ